VLKNNGTDAVTVTADGSFKFPTALHSGATYAATIGTQPSSPTAQRCVIEAGTGKGTVTAAVTSINVACYTTATVGQFLWTANPYDAGGSGSVSALSIDGGTGALTAVVDTTFGTSPYVSVNNGTTENQPYSLALDPTGAYLYVANEGCSNGTTPCTATSSTLSVDAIQSDGSLQVDATPAVSMGGGATNQPQSVIVDPAGYVYVGSLVPGGPYGFIEGFSIATPASPVALTGSPFEDHWLNTNGPRRLALDTTNSMLFAANQWDSQVNVFGVASQTTANPGSLSFLNGYTVTSDPKFVSPFGLAVVGSAKHLYVTDLTSNVVFAFSYDTTGLLTQINSYSVGSSPTGIAIDPTNSFLYVSNSGDGTLSAFQIASDGSLVSLGSAITVTGAASTSTPTAVSIDPSGQYLYVANGDVSPAPMASGTVTAFTIGNDGTLTPIGGGSLVAASTSVVSSGGGPAAIAIK
jgi:6-phosphogluconolactonase (cycloisomerase 2 family)